MGRLDEIGQLKVEKLLKGMEINKACNSYCERVSLFQQIDPEHGVSRLVKLTENVDTMDMFVRDLSDGLTVLITEYKEIQRLILDIQTFEDKSNES